MSAIRHPFVLVSCAAFVIQLLIAQIFPTNERFLKYQLAAEQILSGELPPERQLDFSPFYLALNVALKSLWEEPENWLPMVQLAIAALAVGLLFHLIRGVFGWKLGLLGAAVMVLDRQLLIYARLLEPDVWLLFFLLAWLVCLDDEQARPRRLLFAGLMAALALATRPTFLPVFAVAVPIYLGLRHGWTPRPFWLKRSALFLLPVCLCFSWLLWRSAHYGGSWRAPAMSPGTVFFEGNNPVSNGTSAVYPPIVVDQLRHPPFERPDYGHVRYREIARFEAQDPALAIGAVNASWGERGRNYLSDFPGAALKRWSTKLRYALHLFRWHDVPTGWKIDLSMRVPSLPFSLLAGLALCGLLIGAEHWRRFFLAYVAVAAQLGVMLIFYVSARQRMILLPFLIFFAAAFIASYRRERRPLLLALVLLLTVALSLPDDAMQDEHAQRLTTIAGEGIRNQLHARIKQGSALGKERALVFEILAEVPYRLEDIRPGFLPQDQRPLEEELIDFLAARLENAAPGASDSLSFDLAELEIRAGRLESAEKRLAPLIESGRTFFRGAQGSSQPLFLLARIQAARGDRARAIELLEQTLERAPGEPFALADLAVLRGAPADAARLARYFGQANCDYLIAGARLAHGDPVGAAALLAPLVKGWADWRRPRQLLAVALGATGREEEAVNLLMEANRMAEEPVLARDAVVPFVLRFAERHLNDSEAQLAAAALLAQHGAFAKAKALLAGLDAQVIEASPQGRLTKKRLEAVSLSEPPT